MESEGHVSKASMIYRQPHDREDRDMAIGVSTLCAEAGRAARPLGSLFAGVDAALHLAEPARLPDRAIMLPPGGLFPHAGRLAVAPP